MEAVKFIIQLYKEDWNQGIDQKRTQMRRRLDIILYQILFVTLFIVTEKSMNSILGLLLGLVYIFGIQLNYMTRRFIARESALRKLSLPLFIKTQRSPRVVLHTSNSFSKIGFLGLLVNFLCSLIF